MDREFDSEDEGKRVLTADGDVVGTVESVSGDAAQIRPDPGLSRSTRRRLGWTEEGAEMYELQTSKVSDITDDEVHLSRNA